MSASFAAAPLPRLLEAISAAVQRQRAAMIEGDTAAMNEQFERLLELRAELALLTERAASRPAGADQAEAASLVAQARRVREEVALNQALSRDGMALAEQYVATAAGAAAAACQTLFMGVG